MNKFHTQKKKLPLFIYLFTLSRAAVAASREQRHRRPRRVHTVALNVHNVALNVHTVALNVHTIALNVHTVALITSALSRAAVAAS
eukprot:2952716-Pyramimonas_sp.AAC.2